MNAITKHEAGALPALRMSEEELCIVLQNSIYPGAQIESIKMVLGYCKAKGLDPMQKPVHIVPMMVSAGKDERGKERKAMRDVVMPGVGLYRHEAAKTGQYVGMSDPTFGPTKTLQFKATRWVDNGNGRAPVQEDATIDYPEWCSVTVKRLVGGVVCEFPAREYWLENYATKGNDSAEPNAMWRKRPFGQLAKCAEAQALRKAFPGEAGAQPTAEELEGKTTFDGDTIEGEARVVTDPGKTPTPAAKPAWPDDAFDKQAPRWQKAVEAGLKSVEDILTMAATKGALTPEQEARVRAFKKAEPAPAAEKPAVTFAQVANGLHKAKDQQALDDAASLITAVPDQQQQAELTQIYEARAAEFKE